MIKMHNLYGKSFDADALITQGENVSVCNLITGSID